MSREPEAIALIDLDGTVADYDGAMTDALRSLMSDDEIFIGHKFDVPVPDYIFNRIKMIRTQPGWWENLPALRDGIMIVNLLRDLGYQIHVLTKSPDSSDNAWTEKVKWCKNYIPDADITISGRKQGVYGRILFDDYPKYVSEWLAKRPRGLAILPLHDYNKDFYHPRAIHWNGRNIEEVEARARHALSFKKEG